MTIIALKTNSFPVLSAKYRHKLKFCMDIVVKLNPSNVEHRKDWYSQLFQYEIGVETLILAPKCGAVLAQISFFLLLFALVTFLPEGVIVGVKKRRRFDVKTNSGIPLPLKN
jgi:hypothetical protein